jgi:hypothetical protein
LRTQQNEEDVEPIFQSISILYKQISSDLPFDKRKLDHKLWYEKLVDLISSLHNCRVLECPPVDTILTAAITLVEGDYRGKKDEKIDPYTIYFHLYKDMRIRLEPECSLYQNKVLKDESIDTYEIMLKKIQILIEKYQFAKS